MAREFMVCPRCDRQYSALSKRRVEEIVKRHVELQHPDHDPEWHDTHAANHEGENS